MGRCSNSSRMVVEGLPLEVVTVGLRSDSHACILAQKARGISYR